MNKNCRNLILLLSIFLIESNVSAQSDSAFNFDCNTTKIRVNPDIARGGSFSQFFDSVEFIPLETTKESFFGDIWKLEAGNNYFALSDDDTRSVKIFKKDGTFSGSIDATKLQKVNSLFSPSDMIYLWAFAIAPGDSNLTIGFSHNPGLACFDMKGRYLHNILPNEISIPSSISYLKDGKLMCSPVILQDKKDSIKHFVTIYDMAGGKEAAYKNFFEVNANSNIPNRMSFFVNFSRVYTLYNSHNGSFLFYGPTLYDIYEFNEDSLLRKFHFVFPQKYDLPGAYFKMTAEKKNEYQAAHNDVVCNLRSLYRINDWLFFEAINLGGYFEANRHFMYNLKNGDLISLDRIEPDAMSFFMPFHSTFNSIAATDGTYLYCFVSSVDMFRARENNKNTTQYSPILEKYFQSSNRKSNPVIVKLKLKSGLN